MKNLLEKFKREKIVVSIYNDAADTGNCWTGFIHDVDDNYVLIAHITEHGFYGGYALHTLDGIFNIEQGTGYEKKTQKLYELRKQKHAILPLDNTQDLLESLLLYAKKENKIISITLVEDDDYPPTGFIEDMTADYICLEKLNRGGFKNGIAYIKKEDIHQIFIDSLPEQDLALLYDEKSKKNVLDDIEDIQ